MLFIKLNLIGFIAYVSSNQQASSRETFCNTAMPDSTINYHTWLADGVVEGREHGWYDWSTYIFQKSAQTILQNWVNGMDYFI